MRIQPRFKFINEAALTQPCIPFDNDNGHTPISYTTLDSRAHDLEFRFAPDHSSCYAFDATSTQLERAWTYTQDNIGLQWLALAFDQDRRLRLHIEHTTDKLVSIMRYKCVASLRRGNQPAGGVDCIPHGGK